MDQNKTIMTLLFAVVILLALYAFYILLTPAEKEKISDNLGLLNLGGLKTDFSKHSIPLDKVLDGGPGKDGIPAINNPKFYTVSAASKELKDDVLGIKVDHGSEVKFYPHSITVWHEIVNDMVGGKNLAITFCPLCGSAIVFEADIDDKREIFGVSGKLYESNLLMYDKSTESLWSQSRGEAVVGERVGEKLKIYPSQLMTFGEYKVLYPEALVLSRETGHFRNYDFYPYGDYDANDDVYFPISVKDSRLPAKEIMYVVPYLDKSIAFKFSVLKDKKASVSVASGSLTVSEEDGELIARDNAGKEWPGYYEMWFSWAIHHQDDGVVWTGN